MLFGRGPDPQLGARRHGWFLVLAYFLIMHSALHRYAWNYFQSQVDINKKIVLLFGEPNANTLVGHHTFEKTKSF